MHGRWKTWTATALAAAMIAAGRAGATNEDGEPERKRLIVTFKDGTSAQERAAAARAMGLTLDADLEEIGVSIMEKPTAFSAAEIDHAESIPGVLGVEEDVYRNWLLEAPAASPDPALPTVEATLSKLAPAFEGARRVGNGAASGEQIPWGVARVDAPAAWSEGQGAGVKIAVIDTGIDCRHPDLQCDFSAGVNFVYPGDQPMDDNEHGTHVSGTIAGRGSGGGVYGVAPQAVLIPVKVLDADGAGSLSDIVKGIDWATKAGVDVINMSLGGPVGSAALAKAVKSALDKGVVVVCAAGNSGPNPDTVGYPAGYPGVIAVSASDQKNRVASFSSRGAAVAFIAPGVNIASTVPGGYKSLSGTSMASPHVAGLAALAIERGARGQSQVRAALRAAASKLCAEDGCLPATDEGAGLVDAAKLP